MKNNPELFSTNLHAHRINLDELIDISDSDFENISGVKDIMIILGIPVSEDPELLKSTLQAKSKLHNAIHEDEENYAEVIAFLKTNPDNLALTEVDTIKKIEDLQSKRETILSKLHENNESLPIKLRGLSYRH